MAMWPFERLRDLSLLGDSHQFDGPVYVSIESRLNRSICEPPCECMDCQHGFYSSKEQRSPRSSYRDRVPDPDAQRIAAGYVLGAQQDREYILQRLASHADVIVNRWKKKSQQKRQELLINAVPGLYEHRWIIPRFGYSAEYKELENRSLARRCQLLLPWLSLEVLKTNAAVLFGLLHNRTAYPLQDWTPYDSRQLILGWAAGHFNVEYSKKCVVMYGQKYGELVDWQEGPAHRADVMGFPRARLVLEAQAYLMDALRKIVDKILEGADLSKPATSEKWKLMIKLGFKHTGDVELWSPYTNQAFSAPPVFDINNLISIAQVRLNAVGDHLWFLQTEPAYMRRYIKVLSQGEFHNLVRPDEEGILLIDELSMDILSYWWWCWVKNECEHVKSVHDRFRDSICLGERLPPRYDLALGALELLLVNLVNFCTGHLGNTVPQRPGFRHQWSLERNTDEKGRATIITRRKTKTPTGEVFYEDPLDWCLGQMRGVPDQQTNFDHAMLFAFLQDHLANSSAKEKARVDEILYQKLSDLAAYHEMLVSVRLHRPQNKARNIDEVLQSENREAWKAWKCIGSSSIIPVQDRVALGTSLLKDFYYAPLPSGQKNVAWLQRSKAIRRALEAFWTGLRKLSAKSFQNSDFSAEEVRAIFEILSANRSPEYIDAVQAEHQQILATIERALAPTAIPIQEEWGPTKAKEPTAFAPKPKAKTRPTEQPEPTEEAETGVDSPTLPPPPQIFLTKRAYGVFTLMFPSTTEEASKGVDWNFFVHAMADAGFAARNGGGSAVVFEKVNSEEVGRGGKIVFHRPHPVAKIDPIMLHSMGKRMAKWFGWRKEVFVLEE